MKNLFIYILLCLFFAGCELTLTSPSDSVSYEETLVSEQYYCMYDPMPLESGMQYCNSFSNADCCVWEQQHSEDWICEYHWCFYWDTCEWEYIQSECVW